MFGVSLYIVLLLTGILVADWVQTFLSNRIFLAIFMIRFLTSDYFSIPTKHDAIFGTEQVGSYIMFLTCNWQTPVWYLRRDIDVILTSFL
jgi:hypothetical protein